MTGTLRIPNELILFNHAIAVTGLEWLVREYNCTIESMWYEGTETCYEITGREIPKGDFRLEFTSIVPGVLKIKIKR